MQDAPNPFDAGYFGSEELRSFGFGAVGEEVKIAKDCTIIGLKNIRIGNHVRIDSGATLIAGAGALTIGSRVHIAGQCYINANGNVRMGDFSGLSHGVRLFSESDDYSGETLTNPTVPKTLTKIVSGKIVLGRHAIIGAGSVVLPGCELGEGVAVGALSLVAKSLEEWGIYAGMPCRRIKARLKTLLDQEALLK